ncbi:MAG: hypothetical protein WCR42_02895 [bacterium]
MKRLYLILLVFVFNYIICIGSEQIELSSRLGKTISLDSRNYFGLFPDVKDYKSAVLIKNAGYNYFEIIAGKRDEKSKIILSDSAVATLAYVIDNFEGIISEPAKYKLNGKLISGLLRVSTQFNKKAKSVNITLRDSTKFSGFVLYADSSIVVTTPDSAYRQKSGNLRITAYSDIYSISNVGYPIIDGTKTLFIINNNSFKKIAIFKNVAGISVTPPEVLKYISENPILKVKEVYESSLDFNKLYFKRFMVSANFSYQQFSPKKLPLITIPEWRDITKPLIMDRYYSFGFDFAYNITKLLQLQIGYQLQKIDYSLGQDYTTRTILGNGLNLDLYLNVWKNKNMRFEPQRLFAYLYGGIQFDYYDYTVSNTFLGPDNIHGTTGIDAKMRQSYHAGLSCKYNINHHYSINMSGFINYHPGFGTIYYWDGKGYYYITKNIDNIISYGLKIGLGSEF